MELAAYLNRAAVGLESGRSFARTDLWNIVIPVWVVGASVPRDPKAPVRALRNDAASSMARAALRVGRRGAGRCADPNCGPTEGRRGPSRCLIAREASSPTTPTATTAQPARTASRGVISEGTSKRNASYSTARPPRFLAVTRGPDSAELGEVRSAVGVLPLERRQHGLSADRCQKTGSISIGVPFSLGRSDRDAAALTAGREVPSLRRHVFSWTATARHEQLG